MADFERPDSERLEGVDLVLALIEQGDLAKAQVFSAQLTRRAPDDPVAHFLAGAIALKESRFTDAVAALEAASARDPENAVYGETLEQARISHAWRLQRQGHIEAARAQIAAAAARRSDGSFAVVRAAMCLDPIAPSRAAMVAGRRTYEAEIRALAELSAPIDPIKVAHTVTNFLGAYQGVDDRPFQEIIAAFYRRNCPALTYEAPHIRDGAGSRIEIGFVSANFRNHTVGKLFRGLIKRLDRTRFRVTTFFASSIDDEFGRAIAADSDRAITLPSKLADARSRIAEARLDILFYADIGMDPLTYFLAFARLARVQVVSWGHPSTSGLSTIDYFLSSSDLEEPGIAAQAHYTERLHRLSLPPTYLYPPPSAAPADAPDLSFARDHTLYCCPQTLFKIHPDFDALLLGILERDAKAVVVFIEGMAGWSDRLRARWRLAERGYDRRVVFVPRLSQPAFMALLAESDVILDTIHFSGGISTVEALAQGTPVVTWPNTPLMCGRVSYAYYREMGVMECVAESAEDYVRIAVQLGTDAEFRRTVRARIRANAAKLFRRDEVVTELQRFLEAAVTEPKSPTAGKA